MVLFRQDSAKTNWCFTLNNWTEDELTDTVRQLEAKKATYVIGREVGEGGTPHLQGCFKLPKRERFTALRRILPDRIHLEAARSWKHSVDYCKKDGDFVSNLPPTAGEQALEAHRARYREVVWKGWQADILDTIRDQPDWRTVNWYWEGVGNVGKSFLCNFIYITYPTIIVQGKASDVVNQIAKFIDEEKQNPRVIVYDIPRTSREYVAYGLLEKIKNGLIYSGKYEGRRILMPPVHVFVFANFPPDTDKMSEDRWNVVEIDAHDDDEVVYSD